MTRIRTWSLNWVILILAPIALAACSLHKKPPPEQLSAAAADLVPGGPHASISISYANKRDSLASFEVVKYDGAHVLFTHQDGDHGEASVVLFDGGETIWQFEANGSLLADLPALNLRRALAVSKVEYGKLPKDFLQDIPESGPPEPLESGSYYVVTVRRALGSRSYRAIKVNPDGTLETYAAEPRAGTSYELCCDLDADFASNSSAPSPTAPFAGGGDFEDQGAPSNY